MTNVFDAYETMVSEAPKATEPVQDTGGMFDVQGDIPQNPQEVLDALIVMREQIAALKKQIGGETNESNGSGEPTGE